MGKFLVVKVARVKRTNQSQYSVRIIFQDKNNTLIFQNCILATFWRTLYGPSILHIFIERIISNKYLILIIIPKYIFIVSAILFSDESCER